ncbi:MAG: ATP-binding cassette domain-containing protein [Oscillospiraceae bacterium]|nr:ATP-binding cassette domain-containing protein [Oscillospiraceae bacterium]
MMMLSEIAVSYGDKAVLQHCSLQLAAGEHVALTGPSGCGKTTLLRLAAGLLRPDSGTVRVSAQRIAMLFQETRLLPWRTAAQNVNLVLSDGSATMAQARAMLARAGLAGAEDQYPEALSGGMRQRVALCRALCYGGDLVLLDEPLEGLDPALYREMLALVQEETAGKALLLATHSPEEAAALCTHTLTYRDGQFV